MVKGIPFDSHNLRLLERKAYAFWKTKPMPFGSQKACCLLDGRGSS
jgi:hypothetical protein